jgi:hypothetical protein
VDARGRAQERAPWWDVEFKISVPTPDAACVKHAVLITLVALAAPAFAGCGGGSGGAGSSAPASTAALRDVLPPTSLVLRSPDVGSGYVVEPSDTRHVTLASELQHESVKARAADRHAYIAGYIIEYVRPGVAVLSEALTYRKAGAARIVSTDRAAVSYLSRALHGRVARAPRAAPGQARIMIEGTLRGLPVYVYGWQRGRVLEVVTLFGPHASKARLMALARKQDMRLTHPTFGDA